MLIRFWRPLQQAARRRPAMTLVIAVVAVAAGAFFARERLLALPEPSARQWAVIAAILTMTAMTARRAGAAIGALLASVFGAMLAAALGQSDWGQLQVMLAAGLALQIPLSLGLRAADSEEAFLNALGRGGSFVTVAGQFITLGFLALGWHMALGAVGMMVAALLLPQALAARNARLQPAWRQLAPLETRRSRLTFLAVIPVIAGVVLLITRPLPVSGGHEPLVAMVVVFLLLWLGLTGDFKATTAANLGLASGLGWASLLPPLPAATVTVAVALSQTAPLLARFRREALSGWHDSVALFALLALGIGLVDLDIQAMTLITAAMGALAMIALHPPVGVVERTGDALAVVKRIFWHAEPYWRFYASGKLRFDPVYRQLIAQKRPWSRVLDIGCGPGLTSALCAARDDVSAYCGVDLDRDKLLVARQALARAGRALDDKWQLAQATLPLGNTWSEAFDTALIIDVLHYWPADRQRALLIECREALAPGGTLYLREGRDVGKAEGNERLATFFALNPKGPLHFLTEQRLADLLTETGFDVVSREPSGLDNLFWQCRKRA